MKNSHQILLRKYFSNIQLRKLIEFSNDENREQIINEICNFDNYTEILINPFGNYVVQKALEHANKTQKSKMFLVFFSDIIKNQR